MTLRMEKGLGQLPAVVERYARDVATLDRGLDAAREALAAWGRDLDEGDGAVVAAMANSPDPYALSCGEPVDAALPAPPFAPCTVIGSDGSSIEPDRFAAVPCYVLNTGFVVLPYGVPGEAVLDSLPVIGPEETLDQGEDDGNEGAGPAAWGVNLRRDVSEFVTGARLAVERASNGAVVLLLDGTFFPWDLDSRTVAEKTRRELASRLRDELELLSYSAEHVSVGAYVSGTRSGDVARSLGALAAQPGPGWPASDALVFARLLGDGERSALFRAQSGRRATVEELFPSHQQVRFFYFRTGEDIARVELPAWAASPAGVARLHAALVDQCCRCGGYPRALQEAHEQAVITMGDRAQFSRLLEREASFQGLCAGSNGKHASKKRRAI